MNDLSEIIRLYRYAAEAVTVLKFGCLRVTLNGDAVEDIWKETGNFEEFRKGINRYYGRIPVYGKKAVKNFEKVDRILRKAQDTGSAYNGIF